MKYLLLLALCFGCSWLGDKEQPAAAPSDKCTGSEDCGSDIDCAPMCEKVERLGCADVWGIDAMDGNCLELCKNSKPGLCPKLAALQPTCEKIDTASECQK